MDTKNATVAERQLLAPQCIVPENWRRQLHSPKLKWKIFLWSCEDHYTFQYIGSILGIMEKNMEATKEILGLYRDNGKRFHACLGGADKAGQELGCSSRLA